VFFAKRKAAEERRATVKEYVWRPLYVLFVIVVLSLAVRFFLLPHDFGVQEQGYKYGYYRGGNVAEWQSRPPHFRSVADCADCHRQAESLIASPHVFIACQNCHGPAAGHPDDPPKLAIDTGRGLCLRCHADFSYSAGGRDAVPGIAPLGHYPGRSCVGCHDPHQPRQEVRP
jgi:predicted CXXCH cytochrome family protein